MAAKSKSGQKPTGIKLIEGATDILLIAPHSPVDNGEPKDDENTWPIVERAAHQLGCSAIINTVYRKPDKKNPVSVKNKRLDLNLIEEAELHPTFLDSIRAFVNSPGKTLVIWVHGADDDKALEIAQNGNYKFAPESINAFIGCGQGKNPRTKIGQSSPTAEIKTVEQFRAALIKNGMNAEIAADDASNYRGRDPKRMNQWFLKQGYNFDQVESIQLEIKKGDFRDLFQNIEKTSDILAKSLGQKPLIPILVDETEADEQLVATAFEHLKSIFSKHKHRAMLEAGQYLVRTFYGSYENARYNKKIRGESLNQLIEKIKEDSGKVPSKSWIYNAVGLAALEDYFSSINFQTFGKLGHSQKLLLLHVPKIGKIDKPTDEEQIDYAFKEKKRLAQFAIKKKYSVRQFRDYIKTEYPNEDIDLKKVPPRKELRLCNADILRQSWTLARSRVENCQKEIRSYRKAIDKIGFVLAEKRNDLPDRKGKFQDWTDSKNNVNFCKGCENDCIYCYSKPGINFRCKVEKGHWHEMIKDPEKVKMKRNLHDGLVGFPSTHDITPSNIDAYLSILGNLLLAGNEVLIVSKPRIDCIKRICDACYFFKDKILFRFTIGAMDDKILSFWEPKAPEYQERKECLGYAFEHGFRTSVSMEPMLDTPNIEVLIKDLNPLVSKDIWLGTMNHLAQIRKGADERLIQEIGIIENNQRPEMLAAIYNTYKDNSKIKWKTDAWKIIESYLISGRFSGWDKERIQTEDGTEIEATTPLIISASRATDLPGVYSDWFIERLRQGYLVKRQPRNTQIIEHISFSKTRLIVFWTKNPKPMFKHLDEIDKMGIGYYFQYTLNDYDTDNFEPNVPSLQKRINYFKTLSDKIGKERVIWRFDPLILTDQISRENLVEKVHNIMCQLTGYTEKLVISFLKKARIKYRDFAEDYKNYVAKHLGEMGKEFRIKVATCAEENDLLRYDIDKNKCIDDALIRKVFSKDTALMEFIGDGTGLEHELRPGCGCIVSKDIGERNTCLHLCKYCYANDSENAVKENFKRISQTGEMLLPDLPH